MLRPPPRSTLPDPPFPYRPPFRSQLAVDGDRRQRQNAQLHGVVQLIEHIEFPPIQVRDDLKRSGLEAITRLGTAGAARRVEKFELHAVIGQSSLQLWLFLAPRDTGTRRRDDRKGAGAGQEGEK